MQSPSETFVALRREYLEKRFARLNPVQRQAVYAVKGPLLILAGAGSGKTTVLVNRIANLILHGDAYHSDNVSPEPTEEDIAALRACLQDETVLTQRLAQQLAVDPVRPYNILAITFTNKAAGELKARLRNLLGEGMGGDVFASTFHSACVRILRQDAEKVGFPKAFTIYDTDDQKRVLKDVYKSLNIDEKFLAPRACASAIGRLKDRMLSPKDAAETAGDVHAQLVARVYAAYASRCRAAGAFDFDDLIYYTVRLLADNPDTRAYYQKRFRYILVDEYQDTSVAQFQLVNLLCSAACNICVVGDDDQSIYRFRGATIENILSFEERFPGAQVIRLEQNYRSTANILNAANAVIRNNAGRKGKTLWTSSGEGSKIEHYTAENEQEEAAHIAEVVGQHLKNGAFLRDHVILYRMNAQSSPIENYFARSGIPYEIVGGLRFNDRKEVRDIHAYMSVVANPQDDLRLRRIINEPTRKIGATTVDTVAEIAEGLGVPMLEVVRTANEYPALSRAASALAGFYRIYEQLLESHEQKSLDEFAADVTEMTGYKLMLQNQGEEGITRLENIGQLVSNVKTYTDMHGADATLEGYLEEIALISDIDNYDEEADKVVMMTLHSAKGLEFPYVFIVGLEEGVFPGEQSRYNQEDLEEERRLCYVGITRAEQELYLLSCRSRMLYGQTRRNMPSRFLEEISPELLDEQGLPPAAAFVPAFGGEKRFGQGGYLDPSYNPGSGGRRAAAPARPGGGIRASLDRVAAKPAGAPANTGVTFAPGDKVEHKVFGAGEVLRVTPVAGDNIIEIKFEKVGVKKTMANYAPLKKL